MVSQDAVTKSALYVSVALAFLLGYPTPQARAAEVVAIVEYVSAPGIELALLDRLERGQTIDLGSTDILVIGYLNSCVSEAVIGGRVTIGRNQSIVNGGRGKRVVVECDGGNLRLTKEQAGKSGALVFRRKKAGKPKPELRIYSLRPFINFERLGARAKNNEVVIERLDQSNEPFRLNFVEPRVDLAKRGISLRPGGVYRASIGSSSITFIIDKKATDEAVSLLSRLIQF